MWESTLFVGYKFIPIRRTTMNDVFTQWSDNLIPVDIKDELDVNGHKQVLPKPWKDGQVYKKFDKNSIALRTGAMSVNVVDVDTKDLDKLPEPWKSWVEDRLLFDDTLIIETANGYHFYFTSPDKLIRTTTKKDDKGTKIPYIDFRGEGGLIFVHSDSKVANYKVICDAPPMNDVELIDLIPEYRKQVIPQQTDVVGFENLDDPEDKEICPVSLSGKQTLEEVMEQVALVSSGVSRDEWMRTISSAYNLIDHTPERLKEPLREWSESGATDEHPYEDEAFESVWNQIVEGKFGTAYKGGTLVTDARNGRVELFKADVEKSSTVEDLDAIAEKIKSSKMKPDARSNLCDVLADKCKIISGSRDKSKWNRDTKYVDVEKAKQRQQDAKDSGLPDYVYTEKGIKYLPTYANLEAFVASHSTEKFEYDIILKRGIINGNYDIETGEQSIAYSKLADEVARMGISSSIMSHFEAVMFSNTVNRLMETIEDLPEWDGVTDHIANVASTLVTKIASPNYVREVMQCFSIQAIAAWDAKERTPHRLSRLESVLTFVGKQGSGKTTWVGELMPDRMRNYFKDGVELNPSDKDSYIQATSAGLVELGELDATTKKSDIATLKAFLSNTEDEFRAPYGRFAERYKRQTVFVGTVNGIDFLKDATGSRRFLVLDVTKVNLPKAEEVQGMWAQALHLYLNGTDWRMDDAHIKERDNINEMFTDVGRAGDIAREFVESLIDSDSPKIRMSITKISDALDLKLNSRERSDFANALVTNGLLRNTDGKF